MRRANGFSLPELIVALTLLSAIASSIFALLRDHRRYYAVQARTAEARDAVRIAAVLLTSELRNADPASDFYSLEPDSLALRSTVGMGTLCAATASAGLEIRVVTGSFGDGRADSVLLYRELDPAQPDGRGVWEPAALARVDRGPAGRCSDGGPSDLTLHLEPASKEVGLAVGTPVRAFRPYVYRLYEREGVWWLGQRLRDGPIQPIVGPMADPASGGLLLEYLDSERATAAGPDAIGVVRVTLKSIGATLSRPGRPWPAAGDSVALLIHPRNS